MVYLITYDLNKPGQDYPQLYEAIQAMGAWWHYLDSTWLVETRLDAAAIRDRLRAVIDSGDHVLVVRLGPEWASYLPERANDWISQRASLTV